MKSSEWRWGEPVGSGCGFRGGGGSVEVGDGGGGGVKTGGRRLDARLERWWWGLVTGMCGVYIYIYIYICILFV